MTDDGPPLTEEPKALVERLLLRPPPIDAARPIVETLAQDDDLVAILRGQLHIEAMLGARIASEYPQGSGDLLDYIGYFDKI